jgi:hypothetical protein
MYEMRCGSMFDLFHTEEGSHNEGADHSGILEIFIPSPEDYTREDSFSWHTTTRNFFAFLFDKPLVGASLGKALVDLQNRLQLFRSEDVDNAKDLATYMRNIGYLNFNNCADYALAVLYYAEHFQHRELWIDAFCHCVGMHDILGTSLEFEVSHSPNS